MDTARLSTPDAHPGMSAVPPGARPAAALSTAALAPAETRPLRVALVEDSVLIRARLEEALTELPNVIVTGFAETESAARAMLASGDWDLLILDLQLKQGNGLNILRALQDLPASKRGQVAIFTNYAFAQYRERSRALGADHFFDKARDIPRLLHLVSDLAASRRGPLS